MDLIEILKNCAQGTKLYSPIAGTVKFNKIIESEGLGFYIAVETNYGRLLFDSEGKTYEDGECLLFPSKEQRDWSKFKVSSEKENNPWVSVDNMLPYECEETTINDNLTCRVITKDYLGHDYIAHMKRGGDKWVWVDFDNNPINKEIKYWTIIPRF